MLAVLFMLLLVCLVAAAQELGYAIAYGNRQAILICEIACVAALIADCALLAHQLSTT